MDSSLTFSIIPKLKYKRKFAENHEVITEYLHLYSIKLVKHYTVFIILWLVINNFPQNLPCHILEETQTLNVLVLSVVETVIKYHQVFSLKCSLHMVPYVL